MSRKTAEPTIDHSRVELDGVRYVILRENVFAQLCKKAKIPLDDSSPSATGAAAFDLDQPSLAQKLVRQRRASGLSQAELARQAGIRPETLNRIERGRTTPDFATIRKLVVAMNAAEQNTAALSLSTPSPKEK
jgi:DNA-binding XRE family transcriptional regulator